MQKNLHMCVFFRTFARYYFYMKYFYIEKRWKHIVLGNSYTVCPGR